MYLLQSANSDRTRLRPMRGLRLEMLVVTTYDIARFGAIECVVEKLSPTTFKDRDGTVYYKAANQAAPMQTASGPHKCC